MNAVGIDVSKGKSMMAALHENGIRVTVLNPLLIKLTPILVQTQYLSDLQRFRPILNLIFNLKGFINLG